VCDGDSDSDVDVNGDGICDDIKIWGGLEAVGVFLVLL
jgi:hypothetical protein